MGEVSEEEVEKEYQKAIEILEEIEFKKMLSGEEDQLSAMIEINPGAGGTESNDWAEILMRMYIMCMCMLRVLYSVLLCLLLCWVMLL